MISKEEMIPLILEADPTFKPMWQAFCEEWNGETDLPLYIALSSLAEHLTHRLKRHETEGFPAIFDVVERWHLEGDQWAREAAIVGLLESLQSKASSTEFKRWLRPTSAQAWEQLNSFWTGEIPFMKDSSAQRSD